MREVVSVVVVRTVRGEPVRAHAGGGGEPGQAAGAARLLRAEPVLRDPVCRQREIPSKYH